MAARMVGTRPRLSAAAGTDVASNTRRPHGPLVQGEEIEP